MGGDLATAPAGKAPTFLVAAMKDPMGAQSRSHPDHQGAGSTLRQGAGEDLRRRVVGQPQAGQERQAAAGRRHGDVAKATWTNTIGAPELAAVWKDPEFKPTQRAVYYARVIEIPTPRWTAYDQVRFGVKMRRKFR